MTGMDIDEAINKEREDHNKLRNNIGNAAVMMDNP
jgi:hypothetical protein